MNLQGLCEQYAAFRQALGERFEVNGRQLKAFAGLWDKTLVLPMSRGKK